MQGAAPNKICKCGRGMQCVFVWDNAQETDEDHAYNLYACHRCGTILKEDVWEHAGKRWIGLSGELTFEPRAMEFRVSEEIG